jgi:light-regulated signal transduction histidine kinase (bacteriophytochrome)
MVDDLLAFSRIGRTQMRADVVDVDALVATCIRELAPELRGRRVEWSIAPLPPTHGDASLLKLAFQNLLANAVKYTGTRAVAHVEVGARAEDGGTTYFVKDDGVGFDMAYAHKLFGVFQRLHRAEDFEGTGIGLANVRRIIVRHGGKAWAEGVPDAGATFHVHLPAREASGTETASTPRDDIDER